MERDNPVALIDMDATLADFDSALMREYNKLKAPGEPEVSPYDESIPWVEARRDLIMCKKGFWLNLEKFQLGFDVFDVLTRMGYRVLVLTKGPHSKPEAWSEKLAWKLKYLPPEVGMQIVSDKSLVYGKVLVDDWPDYIETWLAHRPRGLVIMPAHFWNEGEFHDDPRVVRYDGTNIDVVRARLKAQYDKALRERATRDD